MLASGKHYIGDIIRLAVNYSNLGTDVDPAGVSLAIMDPHGTVTTYVYGTYPEVSLTDTGITTATMRFLRCPDAIGIVGFDRDRHEIGP